MAGLTSAEIAVLNAARIVLDERKKWERDESASEVRVAVMAEVAEGAIFDYLNQANAHLHLEMSYEQLHNAPNPRSALEEVAS